MGAPLAIMIVLPMAIGAVVGYLSGFILKKERTKIQTQLLLILIAGSIDIYINQQVLGA